MNPGAAQEKFDAATTIIGHVANTGLDHPIIHIPLVFGIDFSVTKHVFMVWVVAALIFVVLTSMVRPLPRSGTPCAVRRDECP